MSFNLSFVKKIITSLSIVFLFSGCDYLNEEISECIFKIAPKLPPKSLVYGQVGVDYFESIQAEVKNANDDAFDYEFSLDSGTLPPGITYRWDGRLLKFMGSPSASGSYTFKLKVRIIVQVYGPGDGICFGKVYDRQEYEIKVLE